jgi:geranylgeranyl pyrophosphate synthase
VFFMNQSLIASIPEPVQKSLQSLDFSVKDPKSAKDVAPLLERTVLLGGKRLRPLLNLLVGDFLGVDHKQLKVFAESIERVHAASLAHDDVIDEATERRGAPSINALAGNKRAVLAGDYLLADVIVKLSDLGNIAILREMSGVIQELSEGEWLQLEARETRKYSEEMLTKVASHKTASVMRFCALAPAHTLTIDAAKKETILNSLRNFGEYLGVAFQEIDDTLDYSENSQKDQGLDLKNGTINKVLYRWLSKNPTLKAHYEAGNDLSFSDIEKTRASFDDACAEIKQEALERLEKAQMELYKVKSVLVSLGVKDLDHKIQPLLEIVALIGARSV